MKQVLSFKQLLRNHTVSPTELEDVFKDIASVRKDLPELSVKWQLVERKQNRQPNEKHPNLVFDDEIIQIIKNRNPGCENKSSKRTSSVWLDECAMYLHVLKRYNFVTPENEKIKQKYFCKKIGIEPSRISGRMSDQVLKRKKYIYYEIEKTIQFRLV